MKGRISKTIDGMFSFAYFESKSDTLWLARDPMGEKPLYYSSQNNKTYFRLHHNEPLFNNNFTIEENNKRTNKMKH